MHRIQSNGSAKEYRFTASINSRHPQCFAKTYSKVQPGKLLTGVIEMMPLQARNVNWGKLITSLWAFLSLLLSFLLSFLFPSPF